MASDASAAQTLRSILCGKGYWTPDELGRNKLRFYEDGHGELWCGAETSIWVCAGLTWEISKPEQLDQVLNLAADDDDDALGEFELQLTIQNLPPPGADLPNANINTETLHPAAFNTQRTFAVRLAKGRFAAPFHYTYVRLLKEQGLLDTPEEEAAEQLRIESDGAICRYSLKLVFSSCPWPRREDWKAERRGLPEVSGFWGDEEFVNPEWRV